MLKLVIVAALVAVTAANSDSDPYSQSVRRSRISQQCAGYCKDSSKFRLRPRSIYVYNYEGTTTTGVAGTSNVTSDIKITAKAHIQVMDSPCELILQVRDTRLFDTGSEGLESALQEKEFAAALEDSPLRFSFQDGRVEQLCPAANEEAWVLNLKRGLLSAFQNSMVDFTKDAHLFERDVSGTCETTYSVKPMMWSDVRVLRRKNLHSCTGRGQQTLGLPGTLTSKPKSVPIIKSEQICEQIIKSDDGTYLSSAKCQETHTLALFSNGGSGITTSASLSLTLENIIGTVEPVATDLFVNKRTNLQFDFGSSAPENSVRPENVWNTLSQMVNQSQEGVGKSVPHLFGQLVNELSALDDQQLVKLFDEQREKRSRQFLLDALPLVGSPGSVRAMYEIFAAQEISRDELNSWLTALAFHKQPSLNMFKTLNLFIRDGFHPKAWLAVSSVVHSYCQLDPMCAEKEEVQAIVSHIEAVLGQSCQTSNIEEQEKMIVGLKSIGNIGFVNSLGNLQSCIMNNENPLEVRLAAVASVRRFSCSKLLQLPVLQLFQFKGADSELRIAAYLATMQCPTTATISRLRNSLYEEDTNQVLSFVWTHLTNLQESNSSWRKEVRQMLQDNYLAHKFKTDARKFSRNYEMSLYSDILNSGATVDSNIVFSTKSYLPRSATLNLTLDIFGEAVNVFEVGTRLEGFEPMIEGIFSPKGYFPDESMQKMLKNMRSADNEKNEVIQTFSDQFTQGTKNEPQGSMFARVLGNELYLTQFSSLSELLHVKPSKKHSFKYLLDSLSSVFSQNNLDYTKSFQFINTAFSIPTVLGLPLNLEVNGSATVGIQMNTQLDVNNLLKTKSGNVVIFVNPSAAVQIDGKMAVDAIFAKGEVKAKGVLSSNTYLDSKVTIENGQIIDVSLNVPREKVELINASSSVYIRHREELVELEGVGEVSEHDSCLGEHVPTISGMRVCSQYTVRNASAVEDSPYFPLTGKFQYALALQKSDDFKSYQLHLKQLFESTNGKYSGKFLVEIDTPGSSLNRRLFADLTFNSKSGDANLELVSPVGSFGFSGKLGLSTAEKSLDLKTQVNGNDYAAVKIALLAENTARTIKYEPTFLLQAQPNININVTGRLNIVPGNKYSADVSAAGFTKNPITFAGDVSGTKGRYSGSLSAKAEAIDIKVNSKLVNTPTVLSCKTLVRYILGPNNMQSVDFSAKLQNHKKGGFTKKQLMVNLQMSELPDYSTKASWILYHTQKYVDSNMELTLGKTQWKSQQLYHNNMQEKTNKNFEIIVSLESPTKNMDYRAEVQFKTSDELIHGHTLAQLSKENQFISQFDYKHSFPLHTVELEVATPWRRAHLEGKLESPPVSDPSWTHVVNGTVVIKWGDIAKPSWVSTSGRYKAAETLLSARHVVEARVDAEGWDEPLQLEGEWTARSLDGSILSDSMLSVIINRAVYKMAVGYAKDPLKGKHDLMVNLTLPHNNYSSNFLFINNHEIKNVTVRLDLEKSLYLTSQLRPWRAFDLQLFWNYLEDRSESVLMRYRNSPLSELATVSMPGHYASLTVDKLAPGFSSMNITAIWGESEGSASNAILLSTFWLFDLSPWYSDVAWLPTIQTRVQLSTPFIGFEQQRFIFNMNGSSGAYPELGPITREIDVSTYWQDQFINFEFNQISTTSQTLSLEDTATSSKYRARINSSLKTFKDINVNVKLQDKKRNSYDVISTLQKSYVVDAASNEWGVFAFNSTYTPSQLSLSVALSKKSEGGPLFSGELFVVENSVIFKSTLPQDKKIVFTSLYDWPSTFIANLTTPFKGYEMSAIQYNIDIGKENINTKIHGNLGKDFLVCSTHLIRSHSGIEGKLHISSSMSVPDVIVVLEHSLMKTKQESSFKEFVSVVLMKNGKTLQSGEALVSFSDQSNSISSRTKIFQTVLGIPGHSSSSNYTYQTQIKTTGIEVDHYLIHVWNKEKTEISLSYEGLTTISGSLKRNNEKKVEFIFKNSGNGNFRTDLALPGGNFIKHRLFFLEYTSWENFLMVSSPTRKVIVKNLQTLNADRNEFVHKTTVSLDKDVAFVDIFVSVDPKTRKLENILFSTTTPWYHPVTVKYDLLIDTGASTKHEVQLKLKQDQEIKAELDLTSTDSRKLATFNIQSPYCKRLGGFFKLENSVTNTKISGLFKVNEKSLSIESDAVKSAENPSLSIDLKNSDENIIKVFCSFNNKQAQKEAKFTALYLDQEVSLQAHYSLKENRVKAGFITTTPFINWKEISAEFDCVLSNKYSMFALSTKKDGQYLTLSGTGVFQSDVLKSSISVEYMIIYDIIQKFSSVFEFSRGRDNRFLSFNLNRNGIDLVDLNTKCLKVREIGNDLVTQMFTYKMSSIFETLPDSSLEIKFTYHGEKQVIDGGISVNDWQASVQGENTFDLGGTGFLDLKVSAPDVKVELYLKHVTKEKEIYSWHLKSNEQFLSGSLVISSSLDGESQVQYDIESSLIDMKSIHGIILVGKSSKSYIFESLSNVNSNNYVVNYKVSFTDANTEHTLYISLPVEQYKNIRGTLEYALENSQVKYLKGEVTDGNTISNIAYLRNNEVVGSPWTFGLDLPAIVNITAQKLESSFEIFAKTEAGETVPNFELNMFFNKTLLVIKANNDWTGVTNFTVESNEWERLFTQVFINKVNMSFTLKLSKQSVNLEFVSNIPNWSEVSILLKHEHLDEVNERMSISVSKERQEILYSTLDGFYNKVKVDGVLSVTMQSFFMDLNLKCDLSSNFSLELSYNINGKKQYAEGKIAFLPHSTRIDLSTPIKGFEDMTLIGSLNKKDRNAGVVFQRNGKIVKVELSATVETKLVILKGSIVSGEDEFMVTVGAQNGTKVEPKSSSVYISAYKNKLSVFWLSLEGSYDLKNKAGLKISFSSIYHKQFLLEISSLRDKDKNNMIFNYLHGIDVFCSMNTSIIGDISRPQLIVDSQFGPYSKYLEVSYNIQNPVKEFSLTLKSNGEKFVTATGNAFLSSMSSNVKFILENKNLLTGIDRIAVEGKYSFEDDSHISSQFSMNDVKYFDLFVESKSLYSIEFRSSLKPTNYLNTTIDIAVTYKFALPDANIFSNISINGDYYNCRASLNWDQDLASTNFYLNTNAGYGFENATLSATYEIVERFQFSHTIEFTVDDSKLFHTASNISFPKKLHLNLILPESLFLPFVKEVSVGFDFSGDDKSVSFKYLSGSNDKKKLLFESRLTTGKCTVELNRSEVDPEGVLQSDSFKIFYYIYGDDINFHSSMALENNDIFSISYLKETDNSNNDIRTLPKELFKIEKCHSWNITVAYGGLFGFTGSLSPTNISFSVKHPTTVYHKQVGLSELKLKKKIEKHEVFQVYYKNMEVTELSLKYVDPSMIFLTAQKTFTSLTDLSIIQNNKTIHWSEEATFDQCYFDPNVKNCMKVSYSANLRGLSEKKHSLSYVLDFNSHELSGSLSAFSQHYTFGGKTKIDTNLFLCSNFSLFLNALSEPETPFKIKYETDCKNSFYASLQVFEEIDHEITANIEVRNKTLKCFKTQGTNFPFLKDWSVISNFSEHEGSLSISVDKDTAQIQVQNENNKWSLAIESSYDPLRKLEIVSDQDVPNKNHFGRFKLEGGQISTEWLCNVSLSENDASVRISSDKNTQINISILNKNEIFVKLIMAGKSYEGFGSLETDFNGPKTSGRATVSIEGNSYELNFERSISSLKHEGYIRVKTPSDNYYVESYMNKEADFDSPFISVKYRTPLSSPLDYADLNISYTHKPINKKEFFSLRELKMTASMEEAFNVNFDQIVLGLSFKTKSVSLDNVKLTLMYGSKYGAIFDHFSKKVLITATRFENSESIAFESVIDLQGWTMQNAQFFKEKTMLRAYKNKAKSFVSLQTPLTENILFTRQKNVELIELDEEADSTVENIFILKRTEIVLGVEPIFTFVEKNDMHGQLLQGRLYIQWTSRRTIDFSYTSNNDYLETEIIYKSENLTIVDTKLMFSSESSNGKWMGVAELVVNKFLSLPAVKPKFLLKKEMTGSSIVQYTLNITNGFQKEELFYIGSFILSLPEPKSFSVGLNPKIHVDVLLESSYVQYSAESEILLNTNKMDASIKWRRLLKSVTYRQDPDYASLTLGGHILPNSVELYLNENIFKGILDSSKAKTLISAYLLNEKLNKNLTILAEVQYSPVFELVIYHTVFDRPCSVKIKVNRQPQSIESAMTIEYNSLKQEAFVNIYLDGNPQYAEFLYIDIWQQNHEASVNVEEKNNEVTVRGKINSPALDENFLVVTIGNNNDKIDLNLNDEFIFKAFKDNSSGLLDFVILGDDYKLRYSCEDEVVISVVAPKINGAMTFSLVRMNKDSFIQALFDVDTYHFRLEVNKNDIFTVLLSKAGDNVLDTSLQIENDKNLFHLLFHCDVYEHVNRFSIKHTQSPYFLTVSLNSPQLLKNNIDIVLGIENKDLVVTGVFEVKPDILVFKSYLNLSKDNRTLEIIVEAPFFSSMDSAKVNGIFNIVERGDCEMNFTVALTSNKTLLSEASVYLIKSEEVFTSGFFIKNKQEKHEDLVFSVFLPLQTSRDMKANFIVQLPLSKVYEIGFTLCITEDNIVSSAIARWQDLILSIEFKNGDTPFYSNLFEWNLQFLNDKLQIGAWMKPKAPLTDFIYFIDFNEKRIIEVAHALILQNDHFKSKLILETAFKGHEKYGVDLELQNLKVGKVVRLLGSIPQLGKDLGIDFGYSFESLLNYAVLAQMRIPYGNHIKMARVYSLHKIHPALNFSKLNYTLECTGFGVLGWEFEIFGSAPFIWQGKTSAIESKLNLNNNIYSLKAKSFLQTNKVQVSLGLETPFDIVRNGELHFSGTKELVGSELVVVVNSNEQINVNITKDTTNTKEIKIMSKWRNVALNYLYENDKRLAVSGYVCWDLLHRNRSQIGVSFKAGRDNQKYNTASIELLLPSVLIPKLAAKASLENDVNEFFSLLQVDGFGLSLEGKIARETSSDMQKSGLQIKWTTDKSSPKNIGMFYIEEKSEEERKYYFTLQHFALPNDLMITLYAKNSLYGVNLQYSPIKEEEITMELGYWIIQDDDKERSGVKLVALHPATNTLIYSIANISSTKEYSSAGFSVSYLSDNDLGKVQYIELYGKKSKKTPEIFVGLSSNGNSFGVGGSVWEKDNYLRGMTLEARVNQKDPLKFEVVQNSADPGLEMELSYSLSRTYRIAAGMPNNNELTAKLTHTMYGKPNLDALATMRLNTSRILWGRFELPPMTQVGQELYNGIMEEYSDITLVSQAIANGFSDFLHEDFSKKLAQLLNAVSLQTDYLIDQTILEMDVINRNFKAVGCIAMRIYQEDHFYLRTCYEHLKRAGSTMYNYMACSVEAIRNVMKSVFGPVIDLTNRVWEVVQSVLAQWRFFIAEIGSGGESAVEKLSHVVADYQKLRHSMIQHTKQALREARSHLSQLEQRSADLLAQAEVAINQLVRALERTVTSQLHSLLIYKDTVVAGFSVLGDTIHEMLDIVTDGIYRIREVRYTLDWAVRCFDVISRWLTNFRLEHYLRELDAFIEKVVKLVASDVEKNFGEYEVYLLRAKYILAGHYEELNKIPQVHYAKSVVNEIYQKIRWFWNYAKLNERLRDAFRKYLENMKATLDELEDQLDRDEGDLRSEYNFNAENNSFMFTQELPFEWRAFNEMPEYKVEMNSGPLMIPAQEYTNMVQTMANYLWQDAKLLPYVLPPFGAEALISGKNFITFDNSFYHFSADCNTYLLASDLYHNTFSLLLNYNQQNKQDLLLVTQDLEILVKNNLEVYVNGKLEDLPLKLRNGRLLTIERKVHSVYIKSEEGFSLECSSFHDMCKFHLDGWYMGKTAGLLGTYNNEPSDDFVKPNRQPSESIEEFTSSWSVDSKSCEGQEELSSSAEDARSYESMCELFFSSQSSPFFPCFNVVDPKAFYEMCLARAKQDNTCTSVLAYLTKCTSSGVRLWMPEFCSSGDPLEQDVVYMTGFSDLLEIRSKMVADVVFVVEEAECAVNKQLNFSSIVTSVNVDLKAKGLSENKFAFISFNSDSARIQTINGQIWIEDERRVAYVIGRLDDTIEEPSLYNSALELAADLPYRPEASKIVILIHCSSCPHNENYASLLERFTQSDISLHILQKENIMGKKGKLVSKAIGLEKSGAYPRKKLAKNILPNAQLLQQVSVPQDLCMPIMIGTNGTLFNLDVTKKGLRAWSSRVAQGAIPPSAWKQCENTVGSDNVPMWKCRRSSQNTKLKDWDQSALDEYLDTSRGSDLYTEYEEVDR